MIENPINGQWVNYIKKIILVCGSAVLMLSLLMSCTNEKNEQVIIYEMDSFQQTKQGSLKIITDQNEISILKTAFNRTKKNPGIVNVADPHYKVELGKEAYFLWVTEEYGTIMNINDTNTTYSLLKKSSIDVYKLTEIYYSTNTQR